MSDPDADDGPSGRGNVFALVAVGVLIALGYIAFSWINHARELQNCLDEGRRDCGQSINFQRY